VQQGNNGEQQGIKVKQQNKNNNAKRKITKNSN
jgi:hypothetical protein